MSLSDLSLREFVVNISNSFVGLLNDLFTEETAPTVSNADLNAASNKLSGTAIVGALTKENRFMYVALLVIITMLVGNTLFVSA